MTRDSLSWRVLKTESGMRLLQFLKQKCPNTFSVKALKRAIDAKRCFVNHRIETFSTYELKENDKVTLQIENAEHKKNKLSILYEDQALLIIDKPVGVVCDPSLIKNFFNRKAPKAIESYASDQNETLNRDAYKNLLLVHRLDKETTGVLILAKSDSIKQKMITLFRENKVRKAYLAIVDGIVLEKEGKIDNYLGKKHSYQGQTIYGVVDSKKGQRAITFWKCLKTGKTASLLSCEPYTGRTHQLRVHLNAMGHPILGDVQYGKQFRSLHQPQRNLLHAYRVIFPHPLTGKEVDVIAPIPEDMNTVLKRL